VGGRTAAAHPRLVVESQISATLQGVAALDTLAFEQRDIVTLCRTTYSIAEVSARVGLPYGVVRVLVSDLLTSGHIQLHGAVDEDGPSDEILEKVLDALQSR
jgi:DNA-directed RNA polymerase specialized sigma24 family protein